MGKNPGKYDAIIKISIKQTNIYAHYLKYQTKVKQKRQEINKYFVTPLRLYV